jgi:hypothetical protein
MVFGQTGLVVEGVSFVGEKDHITFFKLLVRVDSGSHSHVPIM